MGLHIFGSLMFLYCIIVIGAVPSYYSKTYNGYTFILPLTDSGTRSPLTLPSVLGNDWCTSSGYTLARITDAHDQEIIAQFIRSAANECQFGGKQHIFVNGIYHTTGDWIWVNGQKAKGFTVEKVSKTEGVEGYFFGYLWPGDFLIHESRPFEARSYICKKFAHRASLNMCEMHRFGKCYWKKGSALNWYEARNDCLTEGGDLASFEAFTEKDLKVSLAELGLNDSKGYWVGFSKSVWRWNDKSRESEIKYTNWKQGNPSNYTAKCLCLQLPPKNMDGKWIECNCDDARPFICSRNGTSGQISLPTDLLSTTPVISDTDGLAFVMTFCVLIVVIVVVVVAVFIIRTKQKRNRSMSSDRRETSEANTTATTNECSVYAEIEEPREDQSATNYPTSNTTYAIVQSAATTNTEFQVNNIVYAELDLPPKA